MDNTIKSQHDVYKQGVVAGPTQTGQSTGMFQTILLKKRTTEIMVIDKGRERKTTSLYMYMESHRRDVGVVYI